MTVQIINNLPDNKKGLFSRAPLWFGKKDKKLKPSSYAIVGKIFGLTQVKKANAVCRTSYDQLQKEIGIARSTIATSLQELKDAALIEECGRDREGTSFNFVGDAGKRYDVVPQYLYTADILINGQSCRLTKAQVRILSHMMTESQRPKNNGAYEGSIVRLAKALNLSETTIKKAIKFLLKSRLIYRPAEDKGVNSNKLTRYHINRELFSYEKYRKPKAKKAETLVSKEVAAANARAERDSYYANRRAEMEERAERYRLKAYQAVPALKTIEKDIKSMQFTLAKAELYDMSTYPKLKAEEKRLNDERSALLSRFGISEEKFTASYYAICKECNDSGRKRDGTSCTCFRKEKL